MRTIIVISCLLTTLSFGQSIGWRMDLNGETLTITFNSNAGYRERTIAGMPYSADLVSESVQTLADGTHIKQPLNIRKVWRDLQGRTREERQMGYVNKQGDKASFSIIEVRDAVEGCSYVLDEENKIAHRLATAAVRSPLPTKAPMLSAAAAAKSKAEWTNEKVGPENMEGLVVEGTKSTHTMPVGEIGNDRPLVTTHESWFSKELNVTVLTKSSDPRSGDQTTRLTNLSRTSPDPLLFVPPPDYKIVEEKDSFSISIKRQ